MPTFYRLKREETYGGPGPKPLGITGRPQRVLAGSNAGGEGDEPPPPPPPPPPPGPPPAANDITGSNKRKLSTSSGGSSSGTSVNGSGSRTEPREGRQLQKTIGEYKDEFKIQSSDKVHILREIETTKQKLMISEALFRESMQSVDVATLFGKPIRTLADSKAAQETLEGTLMSQITFTGDGPSNTVTYVKTVAEIGGTDHDTLGSETSQTFSNRYDDLKTKLEDFEGKMQTLP